MHWKQLAFSQSTFRESDTFQNKGRFYFATNLLEPENGREKHQIWGLISKVGITAFCIRSSILIKELRYF